MYPDFGLIFNVVCMLFGRTQFTFSFSNCVNMHWYMSFWRSFWLRDLMHIWSFKLQILLRLKAMVHSLRYVIKWAKSSSPLITYLLCNRVGLVHEDCITKMRLMSLVDLASDESGQIPYALIRDTLRVNILYCSVCWFFCCAVASMLIDLSCRSMMMRWNCGWLRQ